MFRNKGIIVSVSTKNVKESVTLSESEPKGNMDKDSFTLSKSEFLILSLFNVIIKLDSLWTNLQEMWLSFSFQYKQTLIM